MKAFLFTIVASSALLGATVRAGAQEAMSINIAGYEIQLASNGARVPSWVRNPHSYKGHIGTWEVGFNGFRTTSGSYLIYPRNERDFMDLNMARSFHIAANLSTFSTRLTRNNVLGVTMGLGFAFNDYDFETRSAYVKTAGTIHPVDAGRDLKKAKLNTFSLHIPLALEVSPARDFFLSAGGYLDLLLGSHMKWKSPKEKLRGVGTNFVQAGVTARVGFRKLYVFGSYNLTEMFKTGHGPALNAYSFGIGFGY